MESPKLKVLRELSEIAGINAVNENTIGILTDALAKALSKNKQGTVVTNEYISESLNIDEMIALLTLSLIHIYLHAFQCLVMFFLKCQLSRRA